MTKNATSIDTIATPALNIGEVLKRAGAVTQAQIDDAVVVAVADGIRLGEALVKIGACSQAAVDVALDRQARMKGSTADAFSATRELFDDAVAATKRAVKVSGAAVACCTAALA